MTTVISDAKVLLSATIIYNDSFYISRAIASINNKTVVVRCNPYSNAITIVVRIVYI